MATGYRDGRVGDTAAECGGQTGSESLALRAASKTVAGGQPAHFTEVIIVIAGGRSTDTDSPTSKSTPAGFFVQKFLIATSPILLVRSPSPSIPRTPSAPSRRVVAHSSSLPRLAVRPPSSSWSAAVPCRPAAPREAMRIVFARDDKFCTELQTSVRPVREIGIADGSDGSDGSNGVWPRSGSRCQQCHNADRSWRGCLP